MKVLFIALIFLSPLTWATAFVEIDANIKQTEKGPVLNVALKNSGESDVYIPTLAKQLIDIRLDLWCLGKGIEIYPKYDAQWRRDQAFVDYKWKLLKPGEKFQISVNLSDMMPSDPDNDQTAKKIIDEFIFLKKGRAYVSARARDSIPKSGEKDTTCQIYETVTMIP